MFFCDFSGEKSQSIRSNSPYKGDAIQQFNNLLSRISEQISNKTEILNVFFKYHKYPNLVRTQAEIISKPNYLVRILFEG